MGQLQALALTIPSASSLSLPLAHILVRQTPSPPTFPVLSSMLRACSAPLFPFYLTDRKVTLHGFLFQSFTS